MEQYFVVRNVSIEAGRVRICVPLMSSDLDGLSRALSGLKASDFDIVEWRADSLAGAKLKDYRYGLRHLRLSLGESVPILFTLRTRAEGGGFAGSPEDYVAAAISVAASGAADMVDIELSAGESAVRSVTDAASESGTRVVVSHHNFERTYTAGEIAAIYERMFSLRADISKIALMAANFGDCLTAMQAARDACLAHPGRAIIMVSMGRHGLTSRIMAQEFGSVVTFGSSEASGPSAPGQISARGLRLAFDILKKYTEF
ncbi:MAG: type I 3-dehydroquinate dehydratase [Defluviitaleaceae bacterium]|nr:type I 3-dehydroquinate dehydratase [Defluviitaleaceae bacterium]